MFTPFPLTPGVRKDAKDPRDYRYQQYHKMTGYLPTRASVRLYMGPVCDQRHLGSSIPFSLVRGALRGLTDEDLSPLYLYYYARLLDGNQNSDSGVSVRSAIQTLKLYGCAPEEMWAYYSHSAFVEPDEAARDAASPMLGLRYYRLTSLSEMLRCIASGMPFIGGVDLHSGWYSKESIRTGLVRYPSKKDNILGAHGICFTGYDVGASTLEFKNSWGSDWGDEGYGTIPLRYVEKHGWDFWSIEA